MKRRHRHERILEVLQTAELDIERLASTLNVSVATVRRDNYSSFWTPFPETWTLITDSRATESQLAPFRASPGVRIEIGQIKDEPRMDADLRG
jgi:DeoR-like helix-turn-helix domain